MVIGHGDVAEALKPIDIEDIIFFASGVSNSQETREENFRREIELLGRVRRDKRLVYFSSLSIYEKKSQYALHKRYVEEFIKTQFPEYCIIRLGNITWGTNPNTIINYFKNCKEQSELRDEYKYICTLEEFQYWIGKMPDFNTEMNITGERIHVKELYNRVKNGAI